MDRTKEDERQPASAAEADVPRPRPAAQRADMRAARRLIESLLAEPPLLESEKNNIRLEVRPGLVINASPKMHEIVRQDLAALEATPTGKLLFERLGAVYEARGQFILLETDEEGSEEYMTYGKRIVGRKELPRPTEPELRQDEKGAWRAATPGSGEPAAVLYDPISEHDVKAHDEGKRYVVGKGSPDADCVPAFVALGHELIHALHLLEGTSLNRAPAVPNTFDKPVFMSDNLGYALEETNREEIATMGLGEYAGDRLTENALRRDIGVGLRTNHIEVCIRPRRSPPR